ncbi:hypothetical protein ACHAXT_008274 [Thalassiosira profunda]
MTAGGGGGGPGGSVRALAWDPTGPASLSLCPAQHGAGAGASLDVFLSHDGAGCPPAEAACLLRCLDARDAWTEARRQPRRTGPGGAGEEGAPATNLSMDYRAALCECLMQLQSEAESDDGEGDAAMKDDDVNEEGNGGNNLELLGLTYAISHLAEIFLLPPPASGTGPFPSSLDGGFHDQQTGGHRREGPAGSLTADAVRYLRLHHSAVPSLMDAPDVAAMLASDQPEHYHSPSPSAPAIPGPYDRPYWNLLLRLILAGRLAEAWTLLARHSGCRRAEEDAATGGGAEISPEGAGFAALRAVLLSAPLPGGRGDAYCDDAGLDDYLEEEILEGGGGDDEEMEEGEEAEDPGEIDQLLVEGVPPNAYLLWEARPRRADRLRALRYLRDLRRCGRVDEIESPEASMVPEEFQPRAALHSFRVWQETVRATAFPSGANGSDHGALTALFRRFPPLREIAAVLLGSIPAAMADGKGMTWSDALLAELLYSRPDMAPADIATRANVAMSRAAGGVPKSALERVILGVMRGNAGQVIETVFGLCGGASGAALPATMTSLLCDLLVDAGCINPQKDASDVNIQTELLLLAAESILSSFSVQEQSDVGVRTAVRLLLPHAPPKRGAEEGGAVVYEPRVAAMIAEALSHRLPASDAEARDLLQLCEETVRLGSVHIADACESLAFGRARAHGSSGNLAREVHWLLRGMEVQSDWLPEDRRKKWGFASRRRFDSLCESTANRLVCLLALSAVASDGAEKRETELTSAVKAAEDVLEAVLQDEGMAPVLKGHIEANLLEYAVDIAVADAEGDTVRVAADIVHCLEERRLSEDYGNVVSTLADPKMYTEFLHIALAILAKEDGGSQGKPAQSATCAFTVHGMHILMARLTQVLSWEGIVRSDGSSKKPSDERKEHFGAMREAFCKGLMRAFVENKPSAAAKTSGKREGGELSPDEEVELLLGPRI